jgi:protein-tyrosine-phosphatase
MHASGEYPVIPAGFGYQRKALNVFKKKFPHFERNVFVMMPFAAPLTRRIYRAVETELEAHGLVPLRADLHKFSDILWWNVMTYMVGSSYGVAIYEPCKGISFNPNVSIEAGFMIALDRPVLLLANQRLKRLPVDFAGHIYKTYNSGKLPPTIAGAIADWVEKDLSYCDYGTKKLVVFVSLGGTCRCVIAKGILSQMLAHRKINAIAVEAAAIADPHAPQVSPSAIKALREIGCHASLSGHRPRKMCRFLQERADLVVALTDQPLARISTRDKKVVTSKAIFGLDITNPYPDNEDGESLVRYRACCTQLKEALEKHFDKLLKFVGATPTI